LLLVFRDLTITKAKASHELPPNDTPQPISEQVVANQDYRQPTAGAGRNQLIKKLNMKEA